MSNYSAPLEESPTAGGKGGFDDVLTPTPNRRAGSIVGNSEPGSRIPALGRKQSVTGLGSGTGTIGKRSAIARPGLGDMGPPTERRRAV